MSLNCQMEDTCFRILCAELLTVLDDHDPIGVVRRENVIARARAALAQPEAVGPTDDQAEDLADALNFMDGYAEHEDGFYVCASNLGPFARAVLARWGRSAITLAAWLPMEQAPRDGTKILGRAGDEVAVVYWPSGIGSSCWSLAVCGAYAVDGEWNPTEWQPIPSTVAVPAITPIPVSERLPGAEDCDAEGQCWWWDDDDDKWCLHNHSIRILCWNHWLPAHGLPLPFPSDHL